MFAAPIKKAAPAPSRLTTRQASHLPVAARAPQAWLQRRVDQQALSRVLSLSRVLHLPAGLQAKLEIGAADDPLEHEADRIADRVLHMAEPATIASAPLQVSRKCAACDHEPETLQRHANSVTAGTGMAPALVQATLRAGGAPLDGATRAFFEPRFGRDLSAVRLRTDTQAQQSARSVQAQAYTVGNDVVFGTGHYAPHTIAGRRLLAHELTHVLQQTGGGAAPGLQCKPDAEGVQPLPDWVFGTPVDHIPGDAVPGYEVAKAAYTESDRYKMLQALNMRVQINGQRLATFYHDLRMAWMDLILEMAVDDGGLSFATQSIAGIIGNLLSAPLKTGPGLLVGIVADSIINITDEVKSQRDMARRKRRLQDLMVAPTVKDVGEKDANGKLAGLLLDAVSYATWLQAVPLEDLAKFRLPEEFPVVPAAAIRTEIALAIIRQEAPWIWQQDLEIGRIPRIATSRREGHLSVVVHQGSVLADPNVLLPAHPAVRRELAGLTIGQLKVPMVVSFRGVKDQDQPWTHDYAGVFGDDTPVVIFTRQAEGEITILEGNTGGFYQLHKLCHPDEHIPTYDEIHYAPYPQRRTYEEQLKLTRPLLQHYRRSALCGAKALLRDHVDPYVLPVSKR